MSVIIRRGTSEDFSSVFALIKEFAHFQKTPEKVLNTVAQMLEEKELFQCFVAEDEGKGIVGFASFFFAYYSWSGKALYLDDLYVKESYRGSSIGTGLLQAVIAFAKEQHCKKLRWQVSNWNKPAIEFYKKMGAAIDEVEINCDLYF